MSVVHNSTSLLAIIEAWNRKQQQQHLELSLIHWMDYYIPAYLVVVRPLTSEERQTRADDIDDHSVEVYGAFMASTGLFRALSDSRANLVGQLEEYGYETVRLQ